MEKVGRVVLKGRDERVEMYSAFRTPLRDPPLEWETAHGGVGELARIFIDEDVTDVIVVGLAGDYCVKASAIDCVDIAKETGKGWKTWVVEEGVKCVGGEKGWEESKKSLTEKGVEIVHIADIQKVCFVCYYGVLLKS